MLNRIMDRTKRVASFIKRHELLFGIFFLAALAGICYLPFIARLGFYNDDWYLVYIKYAGSWERFISVFAEDRPARAYVVSAAFSLFGASPLLFSLSGYLLRLGSILSAWWILRMVWPERKKAVYWAVVFFAIYPGFLDQPNAIDYQSHLLSFFLAFLSIGLSIRAWFSHHLLPRILLVLGACLSGLLYPLLMEYYIGLEAFRFVLLGYLELLGNQKNWKNRLWGLLKTVWPYLILALAYLYWRINLFEGDRTTTDIQGMFASLRGNPLMLVWMLIYLLQDIITVLFGAWFVPAYSLLGVLRLRDFLVLFGLLFLGLGITWGFMSRVVGEPENENKKNLPGTDWIWIGLFVIVCALIPAVLGNRHVRFEGFGRFSLPASIGAAMALAGFITRYVRGNFRTILPLLLVSLAIATHTANTMKYVKNWEVVRDFWWQVSWRMPNIEPGTLLAADYARQPISEDYAIWGPANLMYYSDYIDNEQLLDVPLPAMTLNQQDIFKVLENQTTTRKRRATYSVMDPSRLLVLSQPSEDACVHALDGEQLLLSSQDRNEILLIGPYSNIAQIDVQAQPVQPPAEIFGAEPAHGWCYYYEQADLAAQRGDWEKVVQLGQAAEELELSPQDWMEWFPFVRAYAYLGQEDRVRALAPILTNDPNTRHQVCRILDADTAAMGQKYPQGQQLLLDTLCQNQDH